MVALQAALAVLVLSAPPSQTVMLDFSAPWCRSCCAMDPTVRELAARGYPIRHVDVDQEKALAVQFQVEKIPCFVMLVDGREADRAVGLTSPERLMQMCRLGLPTAGWQPEAVAWNAPPAAPPAVIPAVHSGQDLSELSSNNRQPPGPNLNDLIASTVRLRIQDATGYSCGSGTIIDSHRLSAQRWEALVLTCGHLFRDSKGKGRIEVDLFGPAAGQRVTGQFLDYDLESDVGLLIIHTPGPVPVARVAPAGYRVSEGDAVISVGCNNGESPSARRSKVLSVDRYNGPPNLEVAGQPVLGRSGGGLFCSDGLVIGVCFAADPRENQGLYAALPAIQARLDRHDPPLSFVYKTPSKTAAAPAVAVSEPPPMARQMPRSEPGAAPDPPAPSDAPAAPPPQDQTGRLAAPDAAGQAPSDQERAALAEIRRRRLEGAEVVCVVRPKSDPKAHSEIIVLDKVSPGFVDQLGADPRLPDQRPLSSLALSHTPSGPPPADGALAPPPPQTILEYTAPASGAAATTNLP
jgi:thiol-disulfide isomerase/thioredoxin